jgi:hypothetical protein
MEYQYSGTSISSFKVYFLELYIWKETGETS